MGPVRGTSLALIAALAGGGLAGCGAARPAAPDRTVTLTIADSRFSPDRVVVPRGVTVTYVVRNTDPIDHELIIGDAGMHLRHENGTEASHEPRPGEVTIPAGRTARTTFTPESAGTVDFGCHLPGHWTYGMRGVLQVR